MSLKWKQAQLRQKEYYEGRLKNRLDLLSGKGVDKVAIDKDPIVKKLKADVRAVNGRLRSIAENEKLTEELARRKAEKAAAPKEEAPAKAEKGKKAPEEAKAKKPKPEKKPAGPKEPKDKGAEKPKKPAPETAPEAPKEEKPKE